MIENTESRSEIRAGAAIRRRWAQSGRRATRCERWLYRRRVDGGARGVWPGSNEVTGGVGRGDPYRQYEDGSWVQCRQKVALAIARLVKWHRLWCECKWQTKEQKRATGSEKRCRR